MQEHTDGDQRDVYDSFRTAVASLLGGDPDHKSLVQGLANGLPEGLTRPKFIATLFACFESKSWQSPTSTARSNWLWRHEGTDHSKQRPEVALEREIVRRGGTDNWSFQMSTMSGVFEAGTHQRRAIDLVHRTGFGTFELIELKVGSNNPVFAAFEILGYGLAYCCARRHRDIHSQRSEHDILRARGIKLVVLAPTAWYQFNLRGESKQDFQLEAFSSAFNVGLENLRTDLALSDLDTLKFEFRRFVDETSLLKQIEAGEPAGVPLAWKAPGGAPAKR